MRGPIHTHPCSHECTCVRVEQPECVACRLKALGFGWRIVYRFRYHLVGDESLAQRNLE